MADTIAGFIVVSFAVYRVSRMVALERGPFSIFENLRGLILKQFGDQSWVFEGFTCPMCLSFWFGLIAACFLPGTWTDFIFYWFALSGIATFLFKMER
jgi:hypothetical protein